MNLYVITGPNVTRFAGSKGDAAKVRMTLMKELDLRRKELNIGVFEVNTGKAGVLAALNTVAAGLVTTEGDDSEGDE